MAESAFIELGSNLEPERYLPLAVERLANLGHIQAVSSAYENPAFGPPGQPDFVNLAVSLETDLPPDELRSALRRIETELGRRRSPDRYAPRVIDLDLCLYGSIVTDRDGLQVPDPDILERGYLAHTLAQLAPDFRHPLTGQTLSEIARLANGSLPDLTERPDVDRAIGQALHAE